MGSITNSGGGVPAGTIAFFSASTAPDGWLKANGATVSRELYGALFLAIGTTYGAGDGVSTFKLPDLRGEFLRAFDDGRGVDTGRAMGSSQEANLSAHTHEMLTSILSPIYYDNPLYFYVEQLSGSQRLKKLPVDSAGSGTDNRPRNVALLACIKY